MIEATISEVPVLVKNQSYSFEDPLGNRSLLKFTVIDASGSASYSRGEPVTFDDPVEKLSFSGFVLSSSPQKLGPGTSTIFHEITCMDNQYRLDKRANTKNYVGWFAGDIVADMIRSTLGSEGVKSVYAMKRDSTQADFAMGLLTNVAAAADADDGRLELAKAGSDLTLTETTTADFSSGTLINMQAVSDQLTPTTVNALKMQSTLSFAYGTQFAQGQQSASGSASGIGNVSANYTPGGFISISGGNPGESANFFGNFTTINSSGSLSLPFSTNINKLYQPKTKSKVKIDDKHYSVITVDQDVADNRVDAVIWTGSQVVGSNDLLIYDIWISSTSPMMAGGVDLVFSDGTSLTEYLGTLGANNDVGIWDQNGVSVSSIADLSDHAKDAWYSRQINLAPLAGKTVTAVKLFNAGNLAGIYTLYIKDCYLESHSGAKFFNTAQATPNVNPPTITSIGAYVTAATLVTVVPVYVPEDTFRISPAYNIDPVKLVSLSLITWSSANPATGPAVVAGSPGAATEPSVASIFVSYDGTTWLPCKNNQALPGLPKGANVAGLSLTLKETFTGGQDPTALPLLQEVTVSLISAPNATTTDIVSQFGSTPAWNTGTKQGTAPNSDGDLALGMTSYTWSNLSKMTFVPGNLSSSNPSQSVSGGAYVVSSTGDTNGTSWSSTRFNFISAAQNFTAEADFTLTATSPRQNEIGFVYRQTYWGSPNNSFAYYVRIMQAPGGQAGGTSITLGYGINNPPSSGVGGGPASGTFTVITQVSKTITSGTLYHVKLVVTGNRHRIYWNNELNPSIDVLDNTYTEPGNIGIRTYLDSNNNSTNRIANFTITNTFAGIWTSPSINLNSLGTCGQTQICWSEITQASIPQSTAIVLASLDAGATWAQCTNGSVTPTSPVPGLPAGTNVTGKSLLIQIILSATEFLTSPVISGLSIRVCGAYPGSSGNRSTAPLGNDTMIRPDIVGGFGTSFDGQSYSKVGIGTTNLTANKAIIANTSGDVHMKLGSRTAGDQEGTMRFSLSATTIQAGMELRYTDANNFYRFSVMTSSLLLFKYSQSTPFILAFVAATFSTGVLYQMRFLVTGTDPVALFGKIWEDSTDEPEDWTITAID